MIVSISDRDCTYREKGETVGLRFINDSDRLAYHKSIVDKQRRIDDINRTTPQRTRQLAKMLGEQVVEKCKK